MIKINKNIINALEVNFTDGDQQGDGLYIKLYNQYSLEADTITSIITVYDLTLDAEVFYKKLSLNNINIALKKYCSK